MSRSKLSDLYERVNEMVEAGKTEPDDDLVVAVLSAGVEFDGFLEDKINRIRRITSNCHYIGMQARRASRSLPDS